MLHYRMKMREVSPEIFIRLAQFFMLKICLYTKNKAMVVKY